MRIPESNLVAGDFVNSSFQCQNIFLKHQFIGEDKRIEVKVKKNE